MAMKCLLSSGTKETELHPVYSRERPSGAVPAIHNWLVVVAKCTGFYDLQYQGGTKHQKKPTEE